MEDVVNKVTGVSNYEVVFASVLTDHDREILIRLYQPLCGFGAISLYLTLWSEQNQEDYGYSFHKNLFSLMNCNIDEFENFRNKLEGLGLLKTYYNEEKDTYIYELYAPLSARQFLKHELLGTLFKQKLDQEDYLRIKSTFIIKKVPKKDLVDRTHNFSEVYFLDMDDTYTLKSVISEDSSIKERTSALIESSFNLELFLRFLKEKNIRKDIVNDELIELMEAMINLYKLDEDDLTNILLLSIDNSSIDSKIDFDKFKEKSFEFRKIGAVEKDTSKKLEDKRYSLEKKTDMLDELEPFEFLKVKQGNREPSLHDRTIIEDLTLIAKLNPGVINVLIDFVMFKHDNKLVRPYIMKVATDLVENNIETTEQAMQHFFRSNQYAYKLRGKNFEVKKDKPSQEKQVDQQVVEDARDFEKAEKIRRLKELRREKKNNETN